MREARSPFWMRLLATVLDRPVTLYAGAQVAVVGSVNRPAVLEILPGDTVGQPTEAFLQVLGRDAHAGVADLDLQGGDAVLVARAQRDLDPAAARGELYRVGQEVHQDLAQLVAVAVDEQQVVGQGGGDVGALGNARLAEQHHAKETGFKEERGQNLIGHERADDRTGLARRVEPIRVGGRLSQSIPSLQTA